MGQEVSVLTIGPAGENMVVFATIMGEGTALGGGGLASVMGSKMLKAVAVTGTKRPVAAQPEKLQHLVNRIKEIRGTAAGNRFSPFAIPGVTSVKSCYGCDAVCGRQMYTGEKGRQFKNFCQAAFVYRKPVMDYFENIMKLKLWQ